jgi:hypothetical protein
MRTLYFDIDGTVLILDSGVVKPALACGGLERAIRSADIKQLVCVGNFAGIIRVVWTGNPGFDGLGALLGLCRGAFLDEVWFRGATQLVVDSQLRAAEVDLSGDWWYMDDDAARYFELAGRSDVFERERGKRILQPMPTGDGADVLEWIGNLKTVS